VSDCQICEICIDDGVEKERERILRLLGDQLVPEILSRINPVVDYNKFIQLMINLVSEEVQA
jgi:hypothetical protein